MNTITSGNTIPKSREQSADFYKAGRERTGSGNFSKGIFWIITKNTWIHSEEAIFGGKNRTLIRTPESA